MMRKTFTQLALLLLAIVGFSLPSQAQIVFSEDFDGIGGPTAGGAGTYTFPSGWFLRNVDNRTPATNVAYVNEAWERREDFALNVADSAAFSTSWYSPAGAANDFMWTPAIGPLPANAVLYWNAVAYDASYPDGYEVRIMTVAPTGGTGTIGNQITNSTVLFSIAAENDSWTARNTSLSAYAGQTVYIGFRNNSVDMFLLLIDDIRVEALINNDAATLTADTLEYTLVPERQQMNLPFNSTISNAGSNAINGVFLEVRVLDGAGNVDYTANSATVATLAPGATANFSVPGVTNLTPDDYTIQYIARHSVADGRSTNDTLENFITITADVYARDNGNVTNALGIGAGNGGYLGNAFDLVQTDIIDTVGIFYAQGYPGRQFAAAIWNMVNDTPSTIVATTDTLIYPDDSARFYRLPISGGGVGLTPGKYTVTAIEFDSTVQVGTTPAIFTLGEMWVDWPTSPLGGWANVEAFGVNFRRPFVIRPELVYNEYGFTAAQSTNATCGQNNGSAWISSTGSEVGVTYTWSNGATTDSISGLAVGNYTVTVSVHGFAYTTQTVNISTLNGPSIDSTSAGTIACAGGTTNVSVSASGGTGGYTYLWSNGATTQSITVPAGIYTATVTDANGCDVVSSPVTVAAGATIAGNVTSTNETGTGANDGTATAAPSGGAAPYTFLWSNGGTTATITGLAPGSYSVTITDANGCTATASTDVLVGMEDAVGAPVIGITPNPNNGQFTVKVTSAYPTDIRMEVFDPAGKMVLTERANQQIGWSKNVVVNGAEGLYMVNVSTGDQIRTFKVLVVR